MKPSRWTPQALADADEAAAWFAQRGGARLELAFIDALQDTLALVEQHPAAGSPRHAELLSAPDSPLRFHPIRGFDDYLLYYSEQSHHLQVIRVWNARRGLDALFSP